MATPARRRRRWFSATTSKGRRWRPRGGFQSGAPLATLGGVLTSPAPGALDPPPAAPRRAQIGGQHQLHDFGFEVLQVAAAVHETRPEDRREGADQRLLGEGGQRGATWREPTPVAEQLGEMGIGVDDLPGDHQVGGGRTQGKQAQLRRLALGEGEDGGDRRGDPGRPVPLARAGEANRALEPPEDVAMRGEGAVTLVVEVGVEGGARNAGLSRDVGDRKVGVSMIGESAAGGGDQAAALVLRHLLEGERVAPTRQRATVLPSSRRRGWADRARHRCARRSGRQSRTAAPFAGRARDSAQTALPQPAKTPNRLA